jgi:hypothetical protein
MIESRSKQLEDVCTLRAIKFYQGRFKAQNSMIDGEIQGIETCLFLFLFMVNC